MALRDLSGIGAITDALETTNTNLAAVLRELQETNGKRLAEVGEALRELNTKVDRLVALEEARAGSD
jgi:single-stranded DNA-specific DHH superfamily exonuclease